MKDLLHIALNNEKIVIGIGIKRKTKPKQLKDWSETQSHIKVDQNFFRTVSQFSLGSVVFYCSKENPVISSEMYVKQLKKIVRDSSIPPIERNASDQISKSLEDVFVRMQNVEYVDSPNDPLRNWSEGSSVVCKKELSASAARWNEFVKEKSFGTKLIPFEL